MLFNNVTSIQPSVAKQSKAGKAYQVFEIFGTTQYGPKSKAITLQTLQFNPALAAKLGQLQVGQSIEFIEQQNGAFKNVVDVVIGPAVGISSVPASGGHTQDKTATKTYGYGSQDSQYGLQVGNALNNAATLLAAKAVKGDLKSAAEEILRLGEELKENLKAGKYKVAQAASAPPVKKEEPIFVDDDNDIPFGE